MAELIAIVGESGSGKTTWVKNQMKDMKYPAAHISRDEIRFAKLKDGEDYFAHEDEVFEEFCKKAQEAIDGEPLVIFVDATHLSEKARNKTLDKLNLENVELFAVNFNLPVDVCITQNDQRTGLAKVPRSVIRRMWCTYEPPKPTGEKYEYTVLDIKVKGD